MKRKLILFLMLTVFSLKGIPQGAVVNDPVAAAILTATKAIATVSQAVQKVQAVYQVEQFAFDMFDDITTSVEILDYLDKITCQITELQFNLKFSKNYSCLTMLNMKGITMNINFASQIINKLFKGTKAVIISKEGRISTLKDVLDILKKTSKDLGEQNITLQGYLTRNITKEYMIHKNFETVFNSVSGRYR